MPSIWGQRTFGVFVLAKFIYFTQWRRPKFIFYFTSPRVLFLYFQRQACSLLVCCIQYVGNDSLISCIQVQTSKYPEVPQSTQKYLKIPRSTSKYPKVHQSTQKYIKVPRSTLTTLSGRELGQLADSGQRDEHLLLHHEHLHLAQQLQAHHPPWRWTSPE